MFYFCTQTFTALGSGYDLSRRDMEMRGFGTIFGADQSGSSDIGLDLHAQILASAVTRLNREQILSVVDTWISIGDELEVYGVKLSQQNDVMNVPIPTASDLSGVSRWEANLAKNVIYNKAVVVEDGGDGSSSSSSSSSSSNFKKMLELRHFYAAGSEESIDQLYKTWQVKLKKVSIVD